MRQYNAARKREVSERIKGILEEAGVKTRLQGDRPKSATFRPDRFDEPEPMPEPRRKPSA
jgi:hypothetical protein